MQSITVIPLDDIRSFLRANNIPVSSNVTTNYLATWQLLRSNDYQSAPSSIVDWIIAANLATSDIKLPPIRLMDILAMSDANLLELNLPTVDRERLIRIFRYSNALLEDISFLENLPDDAIFTILLNLDCKSIPVICQLSNKLSNFCQQNLDNVLRQKLTNITGMQTNNYNRQQLVNLCQSSIYFTKNISAGVFQSLILSKTGQVYAFGFNTLGQLGLGDHLLRNVPTLIPTLKSIIQVAAGELHSLVLTSNGQIYAFGANRHGQLGLGDHKDKNIPTLISILNSIVQIAAGEFHSLVLTSNGQIYAFGYNKAGQLGLGDYLPRNEPLLILIPDLAQIIQIEDGAY